jgi:hypothetical protein
MLGDKHSRLRIYVSEMPVNDKPPKIRMMGTKARRKLEENRDEKPNSGTQCIACIPSTGTVTYFAVYEYRYVFK